MRLTTRQVEILEMIRNEKLRGCETRTRTGNSVQALINRGIVGYTHKTHNQREMTYWGRVIPFNTVYSGLFVIEGN